MSSYSLEIISHHPEFVNKSLKKYHVDQIDTIGVWGNEPFEIRFKNHTYNKVQVKLSVDGTDILTGAPANTEVTKDMWVVQAYGTLNIKAWPETQNGGARLVFTSAENSVAIHTHGNMSSRGIIAAAVFVEGEPAKVNYVHHTYSPWNNPWNNIYYRKSYGFNGGHYGGGTYTSNNVLRQSSIGSTMDNAFSVASEPVLSCNTSEVSSNNMEEQSLEKLVAVGAGEHVEQKISYVQGLIKPLFTETVRVRYLWWDDLVAKLSSAEVEAPHGSGFPGDKQNIMSLGSTPRLVTHASVRRVQEVKKPVFTRF